MHFKVKDNLTNYPKVVFLIWPQNNNDLIEIKINTVEPA
jgi:hypothetical protein